MKKLSFVLVVAFGLVTQAAMAGTQDIMGKWYADFRVNRMMMRMAFDFAPNSLTLTNTCTFDANPQPVSVAIQVPVTLTDTQIQTLQEDSKETVIDQNGSTWRCNVSAHAGSVNYSVSGRSLILTVPGTAQTLVLTRF